MDFRDINVDSYDKYTFGKCIRQQRLDEGLTLKNVAANIGCSQVFLSDMELGNKKAPINKNIELIYRLIDVLNIPEEQIEYVLDMAYATQGCSKDLMDYLAKNEKARKFVRFARELQLTNDDWLYLLEVMNEKKNNQELKR